MSQEDKIDLQNLTQKELLIRIWDKMDTMAEKIGAMEKREDNWNESQMELKIDFVRLETKVKVWGAVFGGGVAIIFEVINLLLK